MADLEAATLFHRAVPRMRNTRYLLALLHSANILRCVRATAGGQIVSVGMDFHCNRDLDCDTDVPSTILVRLHP